MSSKADVFDLKTIKSVTPCDVIDTYQCMTDVIRKVIVCKRIRIEYTDGFERTQSNSGFLAYNDTLLFISQESLKSETPIESAFICMSSDLPSRLFMDAFPVHVDPIMTDLLTNPSSHIYSTPSMLFQWKWEDNLPLRREDEELKADYHADVSQAAKRISKYMRVPEGRQPVAHVEPMSPTNNVVRPIHVNLNTKRPRDAREFREQILSNGAQGEFFVWSHIKAKYGDLADLSWWLTSTKRQFFPADYSPIDDSIGSDFFIPRDDNCLFSTKAGGPVHIEVKGTGMVIQPGQPVTFEISRNELKMAQEAKDKGEEYVVAVVSGLAGMGRPKLECIVRDFASLDLVPTRFIATVPQTPPENTKSDNPPLTRSSWY
jgi:hypothetical protein